MPPRIDPYANKTHRRIDILLIAITLVLMLFAFRLSAHQRATTSVTDNANSFPAPHAQAAARK